MPDLMGCGCLHLVVVVRVVVYFRSVVCVYC